MTIIIIIMRLQAGPYSLSGLDIFIFFFVCAALADRELTM